MVFTLAGCYSTLTMTSNKSILAQRLIYVFYSLSISIHLLVLIKVIPYDWVSGGQSESYQVQAVQSGISIIVLLCLALLCRKIAATKPASVKWQVITLYALTVFWSIGLLMQLLGTNFERYAMSPVLLLGVISHFVLLRTITEKSEH